MKVLESADLSILTELCRPPHGRTFPRPQRTWASVSTSARPRQLPRPRVCPPALHSLAQTRCQLDSAPRPSGSGLLFPHLAVHPVLAEP